MLTNLRMCLEQISIVLKRIVPQGEQDSFMFNPLLPGYSLDIALQCSNLTDEDGTCFMFGYTCTFPTSPPPLPSL